MAHWYLKDLTRQFNVYPLTTCVWDPDLQPHLQPQGKAAPMAHTPLAESLRAIRALQKYRPYLATRLGKGQTEADPRTYIRWVSDDVGWGLFAEQAIPAGAPVGIYVGIRTNKTEDTDYAWKYNPRGPVFDPQGRTILVFVDSLYAGNELRFVNHGDGPRYDDQGGLLNTPIANARSMHVPWKGHWEIVYEAIQDIAVHEQILVDYGPAYWSSRAEAL
ncbi:hypothetical protein BJ684DRAFT_16864 [Piptocephalis cylindrospora]|uniref:SET domain-containing protein n=1 Tax=Piptocephalis cylindrospora TaxID=1907219 RepID=A0A4P9Y1Q4_9FUNG|nr:hypothetical protein BJ684DRAFT_16864 [Piptocephalis cylindrospora]|eukprot:RKP12673.1 hypothetical protein BJ684DRAFT_16864 [Piptocephalis cylindrospora]